MSDNYNLSNNQYRAVEALLTSPTVAAAARKCGLSDRTLWRYLSEDDFKTELQRRQNEVIKATAASLTGLSQDAVGALSDLLNDPEVASGVRARVAVNVLKQMREAVEVDEISQRVERLENLLSELMNRSEQ